MNLFLLMLTRIYQSAILNLKGGTMSEPDEVDGYITVGQAREMLGISAPKMAQLIKDGVLPVRVDALDKRVKLVRLADVERLAAQSKRERAA
jgi:hypothetical protein